MIRRQFLRKPSWAAYLAYHVAILSFAIAVLSTVLHFFEKLSSPYFVYSFAIAVVLAFFAFLCALIGLYVLWKNAAKGGKKSIFSLSMSVPILVLASSACVLMAKAAPLSDISTDPIDPPHFVFLRNSAKYLNVNEPPRINVTVQKKFYPQLTGRRYKVPFETILMNIQQQIEDNRWVPMSKTPTISGDGDWILETKVKTRFFGFVDLVVLRLSDEGDAYYVDMRSSSSFGIYDLGANARRIEQFMKDLDVRVSSTAF
jgi:hypothetical protein